MSGHDGIFVMNLQHTEDESDAESDVGEAANTGVEPVDRSKEGCAEIFLVMCQNSRALNAYC